MGTFNDLIEAQLDDGATVRCTGLAVFDFKSGPVRLWGGFGDLAIGGDIYRGIGNMGAMSAVSAGLSGAVDEMKFSLFGDDTILGRIQDDIDETTGREVDASLLFFDARKTNEAGAWVDWAPIDDPISFFSGIMGPPIIQRPENSPDARITRIVEINALNWLYNRARPANAFYSDRDQKARHPGDQMFINSSRVVLSVHWPLF